MGGFWCICHYRCIYSCQVSIPSTTLAHVDCVYDTALYPVFVPLLHLVFLVLLLQLFLASHFSVPVPSPSSSLWGGSPVGSIASWFDWSALQTLVFSTWSCTSVGVPAVSSDRVFRHASEELLALFLFLSLGHLLLFVLGTWSGLVTGTLLSCFLQ